MHFNFKQAVCLEGKDYARKVHDLSEQDLAKLSKNETFLQYQRLGLISEASKPITSDFIAERNKAIVEQALAPKVEEKIEAPVEAESAMPMDESSIDAAAEEVKEQASSKKKKR